MSTTRAQEIVDLLRGALQKVGDYKEQSIPSWQKVLLEEAERGISSALFDIEEGFSRHVTSKA